MFVPSSNFKLSRGSVDVKSRPDVSDVEPPLNLESVDPAASDWSFHRRALDMLTAFQDEEFMDFCYNIFGMTVLIR